jgi:2-iminobutanoate/2-iminopropanoate deaminase
MKKIYTKNAPEAVWPYTQAIKTWDFLYSSWQIGLDPKTIKLVNWWIEEQTKQVCKNLWEVLKEAWLDYKDVIKTTIYLDNLSFFGIVNKIYWDFFISKPARSTVEVSKLPLWSLIEIELIAKYNNYG